MDHSMLFCMSTQPNQPLFLPPEQSDEQQAEVMRWAVNYLRRFSVTTHQLRQFLERKMRQKWSRAHADLWPHLLSHITTTLKRMAEQGYLRDDMVIAGRIRTWQAQKKSQRWMCLSLNRMGVGRAHAKQLVQCADDDEQTDDLSRAISLLKRRGRGPWRDQAQSGDASVIRKKKMQDAQFLARQGFGSGVIQQALGIDIESLDQQD